MAIDYTRRPSRAGGGVDYSHPRRARPTGRTPRITYDHPGRPPRGATPDSTTSDLRGPGWALSSHPDGSVVRFAPELPITVWVNLDDAGLWALRDVETALEDLSAASGLQFVEGGATPHVPRVADYDVDVPAGQPTLHIAWARPGQTDLLPPSEDGAGVVLGIGGWRTSAWQYGDGPYVPVIAAGWVVLNAEARELMPPGFSSAATRGGALLHELGHAVGLGHVDDPAQLMFPSTTGKMAAYADGDREGLRRVGAAAGPLFTRA